MDKLKAIRSGKDKYKVNWELPDVTSLDIGKVLYVNQNAKLEYVYPQEIDGEEINVGVLSIGDKDGEIGLGNGLSIDDENVLSAITTSIDGHTGNITLGYGLQISDDGILSEKPRVESLGGKTGIISLGDGLQIGDNKVLDTVGTKVSSLDGKSGDITFQKITQDNKSEFIVDNNNVFKRNVHLYQHNISIIISADNTYINLQFFATFENHITSLTDLTAIINAWLGESSKGEGIIVNGAIKIGSLDHQYVISLRGQGSGATSLKFVTIQSNGSTSTQTLDQTKTATVVDLVLLLI